MERRHHEFVVHLGSNSGNRERYLRSAIQEMDEQGLRVTMSSPIYETEAWGYIEQAPFLNQAHIGNTHLSPFKLLDVCKQIEINLGRRKTKKWGPREIDIDIIFYGSTIIGTSQLTIPHPYLEERRFVLQPIHDIAPGYSNPVNGKTIEKILSSCEDQSTVIFYKEDPHVVK